MTSSTKDYNIYGSFLQSCKDMESKENAMISAALTFLYKKGYISKEELQYRKSERIIEIRCYAKFKDLTVELFFDDYEWSISLDVNYNLKVHNFKIDIP